MSKIEANLKISPFFIDLSPEAIKTIASLAKDREIKEGELILKESDKGEALFLIVKGRVDVTVSLAGAKETEKIATLNEGELVGEMVLLGKTRRSANVVAKSSVIGLEWRTDDLKIFFDQDPRSGYLFMRNMAASIAERLTATNQVLRNVLTIPKNAVF